MQKLNKIWMSLIIIAMCFTQIADAKSSKLVAATPVKWTSFDKVISEAKAGNKKFINIFHTWNGMCICIFTH
mgnify:CR=1 FL=1